jgi:hypothetical protein
VGGAAEWDTPATATAASSAASTAKAKALKSEGDALMVKLRYADALAKYDEAYALSADPVMLYNSGRALEAIDLADRTDGELGHAIDQTESGNAVAPIAKQCSTDTPRAHGDGS